MAVFGAITWALLPWASRIYSNFIPDPWLVQAARWTGLIVGIAGTAACAAFTHRRVLLGVSALCVMMPPIFALMESGTLRLEPELTSARVGRAAAACLNRLGTGRLVHSQVLEDVYVGSVNFYSRRKVWLLKAKDEQTFPFPHRLNERFYMTPEEFAREWRGPTPMLFVDESNDEVGRPWEHDPMPIISSGRTAGTV